MAKIYTKVGDQGSTALIGGDKVLKNHARLHAYGTLDELNSVIGFVRSELNNKLKMIPLQPNFHQELLTSISSLESDLEKIQHWCFDLGSLLATPAEKQKQFQLPEINLLQIHYLEKKIDDATSALPKLQQFILPAGSEAATRLHLARTVSRRAERAMIEMMNELPANAIPFINRLSDYFFTMARYINHQFAETETFWKKQEVPE